MRIAPREEGHAEALHAALSDPRIYAHLDEDPPASVAALRRRIARQRAGPPPGRAETWRNWTVFEEGKAVGYVQATIGADGIASLAFVLSPAAWGRSVAHAACRLALAEIAARGLASEVVADTDRANLRARALLERLGFRPLRTEGRDCFYGRRLG